MQFKRNFKLFAAAIAVVTALALPVLAQDLAQCPIRFAVLGDRTGGHVPGVFGETVKEVERLRPDFVMNVGDMIEGYTADSAILAQEWHEFDSIISGLSMPYHYTPGNHDITFDDMLDYYKKCAADPYYSFNYRNLHFIILDNSRQDVGELIPQEQVNWLVDDLEKNKDAAYTLVFFHKPYWFEHFVKGKPDSMHTIFKKYGVDAVFTGHYHTYFSTEYDGIKYTSVGSSGAETDMGPTGIEYHFVWVTVDGEGIHIAPIVQGAVRAWDELTAEEDNFYFSNLNRVITFDEPFVIDPALHPLNPMISLTVMNPSDVSGIADTLRWDIPHGWTVEPSEIPVSLGPGESESFNFRVMMGETPYPAPTASVKFPYAADKYAESSRQLDIVRQAICTKLEKKINIDGIPDEDIWGEPVTVLFAPGGGKMTTEPVKFYFAHDKKNLYFGAYCTESKPDSIIANVTERDGAVYGEDCVGYFFYPNADTIYQIYVNPIGTVFDQAIAIGEDGPESWDRDWNGKYKIKTSRGDGFWSVEMSIPLKQFHTKPESGTKYGINFRRKERRLDTASDWETPIQYEPQTLGRLIIE